MLWNQFIGITMLRYALTNPVGAIPIFLAITRQAGRANVHRTIVLACTAVAVFFVGAAVPGKEILGFFNVGPNDFRIAGWLLALVIALGANCPDWRAEIQPRPAARRGSEPRPMPLLGRLSSPLPATWRGWHVLYFLTLDLALS